MMCRWVRCSSMATAACLAMPSARRMSSIVKAWASRTQAIAKMPSNSSLTWTGWTSSEGWGIRFRAGWLKRGSVLLLLDCRAVRRRLTRSMSGSSGARGRPESGSRAAPGPCVRARGEAGEGAEDAHHLAGRAADGLGEVGGRADRLADREQRLGLLQPLLDLVVQARLLERDRGLGGQGGGEPDLFLGEDVEGLQVVQDEDTRGAALVDERHHQRGLGLEETDPALRRPGGPPGVGGDDRLLAAHRLQQEARHLLERQGAQGLGAVAARLRGGLVGELRADRHHELARLVAQEDRAAVDAAGT